MREKRGSIKARLLVGPSWGRWARESLTRWNAQFSTPNRRHRRWSSISSCRLKIWRGKNVNSLFQSLLPGKETRIHAIIIISFARGSTAKRFVSLCQKRKWRQAAERTWRRWRWRCARTSRGQTSTCTTQLSSGWPIFNTPAKKAVRQFQKTKKQKKRKRNNQ